jgi:hypothetical protein
VTGCKNETIMPDGFKEGSKQVNRNDSAVVSSMGWSGLLKLEILPARIPHSVASCGKVPANLSSNNKERNTHEIMPNKFLTSF